MDKIESSDFDKVFWDLIKDDPKVIESYKAELIQLFTKKVYSEEYLVKLVTGKSTAEVLAEYTVPELLKVQGAVLFLQTVPDQERYISKLKDSKRR
jgi:hypothetical protein